MSQIEAARAIGRTRQTLSSYEREDGGTVPPDDVLAELANLYQVSEFHLRLGLLPNAIEQSLGLGEAAPGGYAISGNALQARLPDETALLRMPPDVYSHAYDFLADMEEANISRAAQDKVEALVTQISTGHFTPGYPLRNPGDALEDVREIFEVIRRMYERRSIRIGRGAGRPAESTDPDAMDSSELRKQLETGKRKPKTG